jgi:hypothetical protein
LSSQINGNGREETPYGNVRFFHTMTDSERDLERTLQKLHEEGITGGVETAPGDGMHVWIGDNTRRIESGQIDPAITAAGRRWIDGHAATRWLAETAARVFPRSRFAQEFKLARLTKRR